MIGFFKLRERFLKAIKNDTLSHAHILAGPDGIGKSLLAETVAREILGFGNRDSVDIVRVRPEKSIITVNQVREVVLEASLKPYEGYKKVIIFYEADRIGQEAQNALLKTIEEPMPGVFFFLLAENEMFMAETIRSRCHLHKLLPMDDAEMDAFLTEYIPSFNEKEKKRFEEESLKLSLSGKNGKVDPQRSLTLTEEEKKKVISCARGIPGKAEEIVLAGLRDEGLSQSFLLLRKLSDRKKMRTPSYHEVLAALETFKDMDLIQVFDDFIYAVNAILKKKSLDEEALLLDSLKGEVESLSTDLTFRTLEKYLEVFYELRKYIGLGVNINKETVLSSLLLKLAEV
ncbi:AAA family ATPase [Proteiniclasticum ruminis]|uniref:AAA family ATPase n=1 Tax=Proteiniclasticum ruminis TaxID=398199 RepID=UPI00289768DA|nr:AAA family ATPase [Proteiniclasticum ruminis]